MTHVLITSSVELANQLKKNIKRMNDMSTYGRHRSDRIITIHCLTVIRRLFIRPSFSDTDSNTFRCRLSFAVAENSTVSCSEGDHKSNILQRGERVDSVASTARTGMVSVSTSITISHVALPMTRDARGHQQDVRQLIFHTFPTSQTQVGSPLSTGYQLIEVDRHGL